MKIKSSNSVLRNAANKHRESLLKSLQHRLEVARDMGNESLIQQLEKEANYLKMN